MVFTSLSTKGNDRSPENQQVMSSTHHVLNCFHVRMQSVFQRQVAPIDASSFSDCARIQPLQDVIHIVVTSNLDDGLIKMNAITRRHH